MHFVLQKKPSTSPLLKQSLLHASWLPNLQSCLVVAKVHKMLEAQCCKNSVFLHVTNKPPTVVSSSGTLLCVCSSCIVDTSRYFDFHTTQFFGQVHLAAKSRRFTQSIGKVQHV